MNGLDSVVHALAWTVVHSLWQVALVAAGLFVVLAGARDARPEVRYQACLGALALALLLTVTTFVRLLGAPVAGAEAEAFIGVSALGATLDAWLPWLAAAWSLGVVVLLLRLAVGWTRLAALVKAARRDDGLADVVRRLAGRLGVRRVVRVLVAPQVDVPATVGWWRPVLLLPVGLANALSPREVESVLAHELAHVRRFDFLVNLFVTLVETVLYHHPAVWWIARRLRAEREFCCDDLAVTATGRARDVATALAALEARRHAAGSLSMSANGGPLMIRIRRLLEPRAAARSGPASVVTVGLGALLVAAAFAGPSVACDEKKKIRVHVSSLPATIEIEVVPQVDVTHRAVEVEGEPIDMTLPRAEAPSQVDLVLPGAEVGRRVDVKFPRPVIGRVVDAQGRPLQGVHVVPSTSERLGEWRPGAIRTDAEGRFEWHGPVSLEVGVPANLELPAAAPCPSPPTFPAPRASRAPTPTGLRLPHSHPAPPALPASKVPAAPAPPNPLPPGRYHLEIKPQVEYSAPIRVAPRVELMTEFRNQTLEVTPTLRTRVELAPLVRKVKLKVKHLGKSL